MAQQDNKYNKVDLEHVKIYLESLVNKVFKLLPLREQKSETLSLYHESLMFELTGFSSVFINIGISSEYVSLISSLEGLLSIHDLGAYRRKVFECINTVKRIK